MKPSKNKYVIAVIQLLLKVINLVNVNHDKTYLVPHKKTSLYTSNHDYFAHSNYVYVENYQLFC